jgi:transposase
MARIISNDTRRLIINAYKSEKNVSDIAEMFNCSERTVKRIVEAYSIEGRVEAKPQGGYKPQSLSDEHRNYIQEYIAEDCSISLDRIVQRLLEDFGIIVGKSIVHRAINSFSYTLKRVTLMPKRRNDERTIEIRHLYAREFLSLLSHQDGEDIFFLDEVGFNVCMRAKRGWAPRGERAVQVSSGLRSRNISVCCVMSKNGTFYYEGQDRPYNSESFGRFVGELLSIFESNGMRNQIIVMDNVKFHHNSEILEKFSSKGHKVKFLPPYSPFLNPIENMFAQWKQLVRNGSPQNESELLVLIESSFHMISNDHCENYYRHMLGVINKCVDREVITDE